MSEGHEYTDVSSADVLTAPDALSDVPSYHPQRGQAYVEMLPERESIIILPSGNPRREKWHRGRVLRLGEPSFLDAYAYSPRVPWHIDVGDEVLFVLAAASDKMRKDVNVPGISVRVCVLAQSEIMAVVEQK